MLFNKNRKMKRREEEKKMRAEMQAMAFSSGLASKARSLNHEIYRITSHTTVIDRLSPQYRGAFRLLYHNQGRTPEKQELLDLGFHEYSAGKLLLWHEKFPEFLVSLLVCLVAGYSETSAWSIAEDV